MCRIGKRVTWKKKRRRNKNKNSTHRWIVLQGQGMYSNDGVSECSNRKSKTKHMKGGFSHHSLACLLSLSWILNQALKKRDVEAVKMVPARTLGAGFRARLETAEKEKAARQACFFCLCLSVKGIPWEALFLSPFFIIIF